MTRLGQQEQEILGYLHQWTNGAFWNRLVILDRASFNYDSLVERSGKDKSYWFKSQTTDVDAIRNVILEVGQKQNWTIRRNGTDTQLNLADLQGIKRVPFDAKQTIFCDKIRPGCTPVNSRKCRNLKFSKACHKMPIWENEAPIEDREFDNKQNDDDFYHENEYEEVLFWEDVATNRESKYFFYEQLKILTKHIKEATPKIQTNREVFKREVLEWNDSYDEQFISKTTDIKQCTIPKVEQLQQLNHGGECNRWGTWFEDTLCPICGAGTRQEKRNCYNPSQKFRVVPPHLCKLHGKIQYTQDKTCENKCRWSGWDRTNCFGKSKCHREWWRECLRVDGWTTKVDSNLCSRALGGSHRKVDTWNKHCGGFGCKLKWNGGFWNG